MQTQRMRFLLKLTMVVNVREEVALYESQVIAKQVIQHFSPDGHCAVLVKANRRAVLIAGMFRRSVSGPCFVKHIAQNLDAVFCVFSLVLDRTARKRNISACYFVKPQIRFAIRDKLKINHFFMIIYF
jgi:hypothetical protein